MRDGYFRFDRAMSVRPYGSVVIWVLRSSGEAEYVVGHNATPPADRAQDVMARIGPIAWEEGQGLERFREELDAQAKTNVERITEENRETRITDRVLKTLEVRAGRSGPPPMQGNSGADGEPAGE